METDRLTDAITVHELEKRLGDFHLGPIDLSVPRGYVTGLVGPNGVGKTTTIKMMLGMLAPDAGDVTVCGVSPTTAAEVRDRVGVVLDAPVTAPEWRVDSIGDRLAPFYTRWNPEIYASLLQRFEVPDRARAGDLSRGQGVKLSIVMALAHDPELLVLDEPSSGLDPLARQDLVDTVREFLVDEGRTVLFSTHITTDLDELADFICVLDRSGVAFAGSQEELHERYAVVRGPGTAPEAAVAAGLQLRPTGGGGYEGLINSSETSFFGPEAVIDPATTDDVVVHLARRHDAREEVSV